MTSFAPRFAAPWIAPMPIELTAFTSLPSSCASFTASSSAAGPSSKVSPTAQFTPAAAISGVVPAAVAMFGSAPCASSNRIAARSPAAAARKNGVCPVRSTQATEPTTVVM